MARPASRYPTELELQILKVLWQESPLLAREVQGVLAEDGRELAKTSVITTLNTMVEKNYLKRKKQGNTYLFSPQITEEEVGDRVLGDVLRIHGSKLAIELLMAQPWLKGLRDYTQVGDILPVPSDLIGYRTVSRVQKKSPQNLRKRSIAKGWLTEEEARHKIPDTKQPQFKAPPRTAT